VTAPERRVPASVRIRPWAVAWVALLGLAAAQPAPTSWPAYPLEALVAGTRGYGLSEGPDGVVRFDVEVVARQEGFGLGFPLVLVRASGALVDEAGGVSAGMSGSPVLLPHDGRDALLGAIGYVFPDATGGLALVTPIGAMRDQTATSAAATSTAARALGLVPIATPILVAGLGERALAFLQRELLAGAALPVQALQGGGGGDPSRPTTAGSAVAVAWVRGDVDVGAVGTVTEIVGDRLLAFGHPVLGLGPVDWPLLAAEVTAIVASRQVPFKLANTGDAVIGRVDQDRPAAIAARLGATPDLLGVTLTIATDDTSTTLRFEVVRDPALWPTLVAVATLEGIDRARRRTGEGTATVHWDVAFASGPGLRLAETVVDAHDVGTAAALLTRAPLALLASNPFQDPGVARLALLVRLEERRRDVEVLRALTEPGAPAAGSVVPLYLRLQPWRRAGEVRTVDVRLPDDLVGRVEVVVRGGAWPRDPDDDAIDPDDLPLTFDELLAFLRERPGGGDLVVEVRGEDGDWRRLERLALAGFVTGRATLWLDVAAPEASADVTREEAQ
jgi:hypothetical protein